jgi:hypothetical protein
MNNMANLNPIKTTDPGSYQSFVIPNSFAGKVISVSTTTTLNSEGWELDLIHTVKLDGESKDFDPTPDIKNLKLDTGTALNNCQLLLASIANRIFNNGDATPPKVTYKLLFSAGDETIDQEFQLISDTSNPTTFYTKIKFTLEKN